MKKRPSARSRYFSVTPRGVEITKKKKIIIITTIRRPCRWGFEGQFGRIGLSAAPILITEQLRPSF